MQKKKKGINNPSKKGGYFCAFLSKNLFRAGGGGTRGFNKTQEGVDS